MPSPHDVYRTLLGAHAHRMLTGACNPMLCPIHVFRAAKCFVSLYRGQPIGAAAGAGAELYYVIRLAAVMVVAGSGADVTSLTTLGLGPELPRCPTCLEMLDESPLEPRWSQGHLAARK